MEELSSCLTEGCWPLLLALSMLLNDDVRMTSSERQVRCRRCRSRSLSGVLKSCSSEQLLQ